MNLKNKYESHKVIFSMKVMGWLCFKGNKLLEVKKDLKDLTRNIYIFEKTPKLESDLEEYINCKAS